MKLALSWYVKLIFKILAVTFLANTLHAPDLNLLCLPHDVHFRPYLILEMVHM